MTIYTPNASTPNDSGGTPGWRWYDVLSILLLLIVLTMLGMIAVIVPLFLISGTALSVEELTNSLALNAGAGVVQSLAIMIAVGAGMRWRKLRFADLGLSQLSRAWLVRAVGIAIALRLLMVPVGMLIQWLGLPLENPQISFLAPGGFSWPTAIAMTLVAGLVIPFAEELLFRGVVYRWLRSWGVVAATLLSALIFAGAHFNLLVGIVALLLGLTLALVYERSHSLWACIVVHAVFNILGIWLLYFALATGVQLPGA